MRGISPLFFCVSLALTAGGQTFFNIQLISDSSLRYMVNSQMSSNATAQNFNFVLTTSTPFVTVAAAGCDTCGGVSSYNGLGSTSAHNLNDSAGVDLVGGASTSGPLIKEDCSLQARNGSIWKYNNQTIIASDQSAQVYGGPVSGLFGLASGRSTGLLNVSLAGGCFSRQPARPSITYGLALQPPNLKGSNNAGSLHWLDSDPTAYDGDVTWKTMTPSLDSDVTTFEIDGWKFETAGATITTNRTQTFASAVDPYHVNMFFPSEEAQSIHSAVKGSISRPANNGQSTVYVVPCNAKFSLSTTIGGRDWRVDQTLLVQKLDNGTCVSNIQGWADANNKQYLFGSAFLSSLYVITELGNPNVAQPDRIGFAKRANRSSIVGPVVGGVVGGIGGIALISLVIFFWVRRRDRQKLEETIDSDYKPEPFLFAARPETVSQTQPAEVAYQPEQPGWLSSPKGPQ